MLLFPCVFSFDVVWALKVSPEWEEVKKSKDNEGKGDFLRDFPSLCRKVSFFFKNKQQTREISLKIPSFGPKDPSTDASATTFWMMENFLIAINFPQRPLIAAKSLLFLPYTYTWVPSHQREKFERHKMICDGRWWWGGWETSKARKRRRNLYLFFPHFIEQ